MNLWHVGNLECGYRKCLHIGTTYVAEWIMDLESYSKHRDIFEIRADISRPIEMKDSGRAHTHPSIIAKDCGLDSLADCLEKIENDTHSVVESEYFLIKALERHGYNCVRYTNQIEAPGEFSWIVWNWEIVK